MTKNKLGRHKLSAEILGLLGITLAISVFLFEFLYYTATAIAENYYEFNNILLSEGQRISVNTWIQSASLITAVIFFIVLFLFLLGQKIAYIRTITDGIRTMQEHRMDFVIPVEGNNELTELAEKINSLSAAEMQLKQKEAAISHEKEQLIRTLSHDIRTPLTSIISYSEYLVSEENSVTDNAKEYIHLIQNKAAQIKELTDILLDGGRRNLEEFENGKLLIQQLICEWEESLGDGFNCITNLDNCPKFTGKFDVQELRRIFDNLSSNILKYAAPDSPIYLTVSFENNILSIEQSNNKHECSAVSESYNIGLSSIKRIAQSYGGTAETEISDTVFTIKITFSDF